MITTSEYWKNKWKGRSQPVSTFAKRALPLIKKAHLRTLLDLGAGAGQDAIYFYNAGLKVTALDFSKTGIAELKLNKPEIQTKFQDLTHYKYKPHSFDVIYAHLSLHYFDDIHTQKIFNNIYRALKPNGLFFVKCKSTDDALFGKGTKIAENTYKKGHTRHFFTKEFMAINLNKFKVVKIQKTSSVYHNYKSAFIEAIATK